MVDVEPVSFNPGLLHRGYAVFLLRHPAGLSQLPGTGDRGGLCVFDKRAILFGSEGNAKIFSSEMRVGEPDIQMMRRANAPTAVVEAVDPIVLDARIMDCCGKRVVRLRICARFRPSSTIASAEISPAAMTAAGSTSPWASSPSSVWSGIPSCWCPCTTTACPTRNATAAATTKTPAASSATSPSPWASSSRPTPSAPPKATRMPSAAVAANKAKQEPPRSGRLLPFSANVLMSH